MLKQIRQNPMIAAGILLPLIIVVFFLLATAIPMANCAGVVRAAANRS